jgi:hypothetical protein
MPYHEAFWVATAAAAPIIALAAIAASPDVLQVERLGPRLPQRDRRLAGSFRMVTTGNLTCQTVLLLLSLLSLATDSDWLPTWFGIVPAVGGILALIYTMPAGIMLRRASDGDD